MFLGLEKDRKREGYVGVYENKKGDEKDERMNNEVQTCLRIYRRIKQF